VDQPVNARLKTATMTEQPSETRAGWRSQLSTLWRSSLAVWLYMGAVLVLAGIHVNTDGSSHHAQVYIFFLFPALVYTLFNGRKVWRARGRIDLLFLMFAATIFVTPQPLLQTS